MANSTEIAGRLKVRKNNLIAIMRKRNCTKNKLSRLSGVSCNTINTIITSDNGKIVNNTTAKSIARALSCRLSDLTTKDFDISRLPIIKNRDSKENITVSTPDLSTNEAKVVVSTLLTLIRGIRKLSIEEVSTESEIPESLLLSYEHGEIDITYGHLCNLCRVYNIPTTRITDWL